MPPSNGWGSGSHACRRTFPGALVLLLAAVPACAVYDPQLVGAAAGSSGSDDTSGGSNVSGGAGGSNVGGGNNMGGSPASSAGQTSAGAPSGGAGLGGAGSSGAPSGGSAGAATAGAPAGGASAGGAGGAPAAGAPAGGAASAGSPGAGAGGSAGGAPGLNPCDRTNWKATASRSSLSMNPPQLYNPPLQAIDGTVNTRWSSGAAEDGTEWFLVDLGARASHLTRVVLDTNKDPSDLPVAYALELSTDGAAYTQVAAGAGAIITTINFADTPARYIRIKQTGVGVSWWTIHELTITCQQ